MNRWLAALCEWCPPCRYARARPGTWLGRLMAWHGRFCPVWKSWEEAAVKRPPSA